MALSSRTPLLAFLGLVFAFGCGGADSGNALTGPGTGGGAGAGGGSSCGQLAVCCVTGTLTGDAKQSCLGTVSMNDASVCTATLGAYVNAGVCGASGAGGGAGTGGTGTAGTGTAGTGGAGGKGTGGKAAGAGGASAGAGGTGTAGSGTAGSGTAGSGTAGSGTAGSGTAGSGTAGSGTAGSGTAGTGTGGSGTAGTGTAGSGTAGSGTGGTSAAGAGGSAGGGGMCAPTLDLYIMMDQSGSMSDTTAGGQTKWNAVKNAIAAFVADPVNVGTSVGIQFFGLPSGNMAPTSCLVDADCIVGGVNYGPCFGASGATPGFCIGASGGGADSCMEADYAMPNVEIQPLPGVASQINAAMMAHSPTTSTPTEPALRGLIKHATAWQAAHPNRVTIAILATDGLPTECTIQDGPGLQAISAAGFNGTPKVRTAVIGILGPSDPPTILNDIAIGGGTANLCGPTNAACILDTTMAGNPVEKQFQAALQAIQAQAVGCP